MTLRTSSNTVIIALLSLVSPSAGGAYSSLGAGDMWEPEGSGVLATYLGKSFGSDYEVIAPEMPDAATDPHYVPWRNQIELELQRIEDPAVIVGHSFGGSVLLKYLTEGPPPRSIAGIFLVAVPFWGPEGWPYDEYALPTNCSADSHRAWRRRPLPLTAVKTHMFRSAIWRSTKSSSQMPRHARSRVRSTPSQRACPH